MELHQLRYFVAVAVTGGFTRAAAREGVTQPTLSEQIGKLEAKLGKPLFDRLGRTVVLTAAGEQFLPHAQAVLAAVGDAERAAADPDGGELRVGAIPTVAPFLLPPAVARFRIAAPLGRLDLREEVTDRLVASLIAGDLDVGIMARPIPDERLTADTLFDEPLLAAVPVGHRLAARKQIRLVDLTAEPFLLLDAVHCFGEQVLSLCRRGGAVPRVACRGEQLGTLLGLVAAGVGVTVVPAMAAAATPGVVVRPFAPPAPVRSVIAVRHRQRFRPPGYAAFLAALKGN